MADGFFVGIDWNRNGVFTDAGDDVSARVRGSVQCSYGRDQATALAPIVAGQGQFDLDNSSRDYSPRNGSSPLSGNVKPARPVLAQRTVSGTTYTIFRGHFDDSPIAPDPNSKLVHISLVDQLADFRGVNVTTTLYQGISTGTAIGIVLDAAGWTGGRSIDTGATIIPYFWANADDAFDLLTQLVASEGPPALLTIDASGAIVFRSRHHRLTSSASLTSQSTWRGSGPVEPVFQGFTYSEAWSNIVNTIDLGVDIRTVGALQSVWTTDEAISIPASTSYTVVISTSDPFLNAVTPVAGTDYTLAAGSISSTTLSRTSGASTSVTFTAGAGGAQLVGMALRANPVAVARTARVTASDSTSQLNYGQRSLPSDLEPKWASYWDVIDLAALYILQRKNPLPQVTVSFTAQHTMTAKLAQMLARNLSDRVTVVEPETVLNDPFFVETITHEAAGVHQHTVAFGLELVPSSPTAAFVLNTSTLNGTDPLAY